MDPIGLGIKFVKAVQPEPVPVPDVPSADITSSVAQTGDYTAILILAFTAIVIAGIAIFMRVINRQMVIDDNGSTSETSLINHFGLKITTAIIVAIVATTIFTIFACFSISATAGNEKSPLIPDKSEITATVAEDGTFILDTCTLTNMSTTDKYTVASSSVSLTDDVKDIEGLSDTSIKISAFNGILFEGKPDGLPYPPASASFLDPGAKTKLQFSISFTDKMIIDQLYDKQVFSISLTPQEYTPAPDPESNLNYQVCIWGFGQDQVGQSGTQTASITFGPATGQTGACLDVDGHEHHSAGKHCIHEDTWEEIIQHCKNGEADLYSDCLSYACTKSVPLALNTSIGTMPTSKVYCSILPSTNYEGWLNPDYVCWNKTIGDCESANWKTSRIRATLNGKTGEESTYAGDDCLDSTKCLLSCFPDILQSSIKPKYYKVPTLWSTEESEGYPIKNSEFVSDKLWLANCEEIYGNTGLPATIQEFNRLQYTKKAIEGTKWLDALKNVTFLNPSKSGDWWVRTPIRDCEDFLCYVGSDGGLYAISAKNLLRGISPFFCL